MVEIGSGARRERDNIHLKRSTYVLRLQRALDDMGFDNYDGERDALFLEQRILHSSGLSKKDPDAAVDVKTRKA